MALDSQSAVWSYFDISAHVLFANPLFKMELMIYVECVIFALCSLTSLECWYVSMLPFNNVNLRVIGKLHYQVLLYLPSTT